MEPILFKEKNMLKRFCTDYRCLCLSENEPQAASFEIVTKKTRNGDGLWEKCCLCEQVINRTGVPKEEQEEYYNDTYIRTNSYSKGEILSARTHFEARLNSIKERAEFLLPYLSKDSTVFELGAATGELLYLLKDHIGFCYGNELNSLYAQFIQDELGIDATDRNYFQLTFEEKFDCILALNTIDHIHDTFETMEKIYKDLKTGGLFYVEVPNDQQALKQYLPLESREKFKTFMYQQAHYYSFTFDTLKKFIEQFGFEILDERSRHDYTLLNYLNWHFTGKPQSVLREAKEETDLCNGESAFEQDMNKLFGEFDKQFREIITKNKVGESICILARKK